MNMGKQGSSPALSYLSQQSAADKPWDKHRSKASRVQTLYSEVGYDRYAERIKDCAKQLQMVKLADDTGERKLKLKQATFCRVRHCPVCQWRRAMAWRARFFNAVPRVLEEHPKARWVFLTLTVRNCSLAELKTTVQEMNASWKRLTKRKEFPAQGFVRSLEVTRNPKTNEAHPHFHVLMMVRPSYFSQGYVSQAKWREIWQSCLRVDYLPVVNIKTVKWDVDDTNPMARALLETLKYGVKEDDLIADAEWLRELTVQLHRIRSIAVGGVLKKYISQSEPDDLINTDSESNQVLPEADESILIFDWFEYVKKYAYKGTKADAKK